jgi:phenylacetate-CoA ligase
LPALARILGRRRNMVLLPNGERHWPLVGFHRYREVADVRQYQLVQHGWDEMEMKLVTGTGTLDSAQREALTRIIQASLRHPFRVRFTLFERELPRARGGKFEEFVCTLDEPHARADEHGCEHGCEHG